jgi:uncharacterized Fe-S cluster protein YjdI
MPLGITYLQLYNSPSSKYTAPNRAKRFLRLIFYQYRVSIGTKIRIFYAVRRCILVENVMKNVFYAVRHYNSPSSKYTAPNGAKRFLRLIFYQYRVPNGTKIRIYYAVRRCILVENVMKNVFYAVRHYIFVSYPIHQAQNIQLLTEQNAFYD